VGVHPSGEAVNTVIPGREPFASESQMRNCASGNLEIPVCAARIPE
jgi:hypothetical protein